MNHRIISLLIFYGTILNLFSQSNFNYKISLVPVAVSNLPGLHSYAFAQSQGKWLIMGGRKDGLHARQPFNSFTPTQNNTEIYVVDVANNKLWSASVNSLPAEIREQLQSTNMNFYQDEDSLYIAGGYGFSQTANNHITFPYLTAVNITGLIDAIQKNQPIQPHFKYAKDDIFAVTGGHLKKLKGIFYLVGGQRFDGRYNPMGHSTFTQSYTNQIRKFRIYNSASNLSFESHATITDPVHLHRRDYNLLPQIFPNGEQGFTISSGVFQINADLPYLYPVDITESGYKPITDFNQYLSNYHSAVACLYDAEGNNMHSVFFGGMSQYYYRNGEMVQDNSVPFVNTISRITRDGNGVLKEYPLPIEMPGLKGAGAEFIPNLKLPHYENKVFKLDEMDDESYMIGHIYGGIESPILNPFTMNQTSSTFADKTIYEVWLHADPLAAADVVIDGSNPFDIDVFPNPFEDKFSVKFNSSKTVKINYIISDNLGQIIEQSDVRIFTSGENSFTLNVEKYPNTAYLYLTVVFDNKYYVTKKLLRQ